MTTTNHAADWAAPLAAVQADVKELDSRVDHLATEAGKNDWRIGVLEDQFKILQHRVDFNIEGMRTDMVKMKDEATKAERGRMLRENATLGGIVLILVTVVVGLVIKQ